MNKNTKQARSAGFVSKSDQIQGANGQKIVKDIKVKSSWPENKKANKKIYPKTNNSRGDN